MRGRDGDGIHELTFRRMTRSDLSLLAVWFGAPHVRRWGFGPDDIEVIEAKYGPFVDGTDTRTSHYLFEEVESQPIGMIQHYRLSDHPEWEAALDIRRGAGIDYLIGEIEYVGRGVGTNAIRAFLPVVFTEYPDVDVIVAAPQQANVGSWRALERAGFERVWAGTLLSADEADAGPAFVYAVNRLHA